MTENERIRVEFDAIMKAVAPKQAKAAKQAEEEPEKAKKPAKKSEKK